MIYQYCFKVGRYIEFTLIIKYVYNYIRMCLIIYIFYNAHRLHHTANSVTLYLTVECGVLMAQIFASWSVVQYIIDHR